MDCLETVLMEALLTAQASWIRIFPGLSPGCSVWDAWFPLGRHVTVELSASRSHSMETGTGSTFVDPTRPLIGLQPPLPFSRPE
jgi:hypothetical protein